MATITNAVWLTDEYAISDLRSIWHKQIELVMIMPQRDSIRNGYAMKLVDEFSMVVILSIP